MSEDNQITQEDLNQAILELREKMIQESSPLDPELSKILMDNFWDYYESFDSDRN